MKKLYLLCWFFVCQGLSGQGTFTWSNYQVTINVNEDGTLDVSEDMDVEFSEKRHGIIRKIPYKYNVDDRPYSLTITDLKVDGAPFQMRRGSHEITLRIGDGNKYVIGAQDYRIQYTVVGATTKYSTHDELYWNVIGFDSDAPVDQASFSIRFPSEWKDSIREYVSFSGRKGTTRSEIYLSKSGAQITGAITAPLEAREGITLAVKIPKGLIQVGNLGKREGFEALNESFIEKTRWHKWLLAIPFLIGGGLFYLYNLLGRKKDKDPVPLQFYPPDNLTPAEVGTFFDYRVNRRDVISLLPFWGELGYIRIRPIENSDNDLSFYKMQEISTDRPRYEIDFFNDLFKNESTVLLSDLRNSFYKTMSKTSRAIQTEVEDMPLYDPDSMTTSTKWKVLLLGFLIMVLGIVTMIVLSAFLPGALLIILGVVTFFFYFKPRKLSPNGEEMHQHLRGLRTWLKDPDPDQLHEIMEENPQYLSQIFPYVLAFGLDKSWEKRFDDLAVPPPIWYDHGQATARDSNYNYGQFTKDFQPHKIEQVFYSTPAPAPVSGSGRGGGFSGGRAGGGFGGGSTSSW